MTLRIASLEVLAANCVFSPTTGEYVCELEIRWRAAEVRNIQARHVDRQTCIAQAVSQLCRRPISIWRSKTCQDGDSNWHVSIAVRDRLDSTDNAPAGHSLQGAGRYVASDESVGLLIAALRAANHAGLLKAAYRANYQKFLRDWASEASEELLQIVRAPNADEELQQLEAEGLLLEYFNRVASAAVVTAANSPQPESILSLFDNSAWLFDERGRRRDAYTDTKLWLAWYPGIDNDALSLDEVVGSMPAAPDTEIPWIVRLVENPTSWLRFRGAVDLEDHDILHVLLGRGLQDQDEAFVLGFAMGTAKRISWLQYWLFRWVLTRLYPEPYRIPGFLLPAFELGLQCGRETGAKDLYRQQLKRLRGLSLGEARREAGIDMEIVRNYYEREQQRIPFTIASLRLPTASSEDRPS